MHPSALNGREIKSFTFSEWLVLLLDPRTMAPRWPYRRRIQHVLAWVRTGRG